VVWKLLRLAVVSLVAVILLGSCSSSPAASSPPVAPSGWTTHTYDGLTISTPASWKVFRQPPVCPGAARIGALLLGPVQGAGCPAPPKMKPPYGIAPNVVSVTDFSGTSSLPEGYHSDVVNGFHVRVLNERSPAWWIPGLGLLVSGSGPKASQVMHTIRPTAHVEVPKGWASYTYSGATISEPKSWTVEHNSNCPLTTARGALLLGFPKVLMNCPNYPVSLGLVELYHPTQAETPTIGSIKVNGVPVGVIRASPSYTVWSIPSLGIDVTGVGSEAVQILHTLRRA